MIEFQHVNKVFYKNGQATKVLDNINLSINDGDIFGVIGYSGAGKSTLIRLINALEKPTDGVVSIDGKNLSDYPDIRQVKRKIGMIFQGFNLLETKTVADNIGMPLLLAGVNKKERDETIDKLLDFVELSDKKHAYPSELSGGQKQRVSIARALANKPDILLCDEATSALDPQTTRSILDLLKRINQSRGVTIVLVTHEMSVIQYICNNVIVMEQGKIVEKGSVLDIFQNPKAEVTRKFINSVLNGRLPLPLLDRLKSEGIRDIVRFEFLGNSSTRSVLNDVILEEDGKIKINILFSNMIDVKGHVIGYMFANIEGDEPAIISTINYLNSHLVRTTRLNKDGDYV